MRKSANNLLLVLLQGLAIFVAATYDTITADARPMDAQQLQGTPQDFGEVVSPTGNGSVPCDDEPSARIIEEKSAGDTETSFVYLPHQYAQSGNLDELKQLLATYPDLISDRNYIGWTLMHEVSKGAHIHVAGYLIDMGADLNPLSNEGHTPLFEARRFHGADSEIARFLTSKGALLDSPKHRLRGKQEELIKNYAHTLAGKNKIDKLKEYVANHGTEFLKAPDANGWTLLHEAARFGRVQMVVYLIQQGVDVQHRNNDGQRAAEVAARFQGKDSATYRMLHAVTR